MKTTIDKLVELAKQYEEFGRKNFFPRTWTSVNGTYGMKDSISIYFGNGNPAPCSVKFGYVEVELYSDLIEFPLHYTKENLEESYNQAKNFFDLEIEEITEGRNQFFNEEAQKRIEELRFELEQLTRIKG